MAEKTLNARIRHKRDTSANWTSKNPVLLDGELILVDTAEGELRSKIGDGTKTYTQLPFTDETLRSLIPAASKDIYYGTCTTAAGTAAKVVTLTDSTGFTLQAGTIVAVKFTYANTASNPTLNVASSGAKSIKQYGTTAVGNGNQTTGWIAGAIQIFVYDGTNWIRDYWANTDTTYTNASLGQGYGTCTTAAATTAKVVTLSNYVLVTGGIVSVKFTYAVPAGATLNVNSKGAKAIYHRGAAITANTIGAGDTATFIYNGSQYHLLSVDKLAQPNVQPVLCGRYYFNDYMVPPCNDFSLTSPGGSFSWLDGYTTDPVLWNVTTDGVASFEIFDTYYTIYIDGQKATSADVDINLICDQVLFEEAVTVPQELYDWFMANTSRGGGEAIIDVAELPTENIDEKCFYRLLTGEFVLNGVILNDSTCYIVDGLPETGEPVTDATMTYIIAYYNTQDGELYAYVDAMLSQALGVSVGWYPASMLFQAAGLDYQGIIFDIADAPFDGALRLLLQYVLYSWKNEVWSPIKTIGWSGTNLGAEKFNATTNEASGIYSHAEGNGTTASGEYSHAEGSGTTASGICSHAEGYGTTASGEYSHAEGQTTTANDNGSHAEGGNTEASGSYSHAEGRTTTASGYGSHAEGGNTEASGSYSHAEGNGTEASGDCSHAEGRTTKASGDYSHAEGYGTEASGDYSHAEGYYTKASGDYSHAQGRNNIEDTENKYAHIVGNGTAINNRSNAHTLDWSGNAWFAGDIYVGGTSQDDATSKVATETSLQELQAQITVLASQVVPHVVGTYVFNDTMVAPSSVWNISDLSVVSVYDADNTYASSGNKVEFQIWENGAGVYNQSTDEYVDLYDGSTSVAGDNFTVNFGSTPQLVPKAFYSWILANTDRNGVVDASEVAM